MNKSQLIQLAAIAIAGATCPDCLARQEKSPASAKMHIAAWRLNAWTMARNLLEEPSALIDPDQEQADEQENLHEDVTQVVRLEDDQVERVLTAITSISKPQLTEKKLSDEGDKDVPEKAPTHAKKISRK